MRESKELKRVEKSVVLAEPAPEFTATWRPYSHAQVLEAMGAAVKDAGLDVVREEYSYRPGSRMLAAWELSQGTPELHYGIGIVNSIDKSKSVTLSVFEKIFVCSNYAMRWSEERVMFRRHSGRLGLEEIVFLAKEALVLLMPKFDRLRAWHDGMKAKALTMAEASLLAMGAMRRRIIPPAQLPEFFELYRGRESKYLAYPGTLWAWHGAATEQMNDNSLLTIADKQDRLNLFLDYEAPLLLRRVSEREVDFDAVTREAFQHYQVDKRKTGSDMRDANREIKERFRVWSTGKKKEISDSPRIVEAEVMDAPKEKEPPVKKSLKQAQLERKADEKRKPMRGRKAAKLSKETEKTGTIKYVMRNGRRVIKGSLEDEETTVIERKGKGKK